MAERLKQFTVKLPKWLYLNIKIAAEAEGNDTATVVRRVLSKEFPRQRSPKVEEE